MYPVWLKTIPTITEIHLRINAGWVDQVPTWSLYRWDGVPTTFFRGLHSSQIPLQYLLPSFFCNLQKRKRALQYLPSSQFHKRFSLTSHQSMRNSLSPVCRSNSKISSPLSEPLSPTRTKYMRVPQVVIMGPSAGLTDSLNTEIVSRYDVRYLLGDQAESIGTGHGQNQQNIVFEGQHVQLTSLKMTISLGSDSLLSVLEHISPDVIILCILPEDGDAILSPIEELSYWEDYILKIRRHDTPKIIRILASLENRSGSDPPNSLDDLMTFKKMERSFWQAFKHVCIPGSTNYVSVEDLVSECTSFASRRAVRDETMTWHPLSVQCSIYIALTAIQCVNKPPEFFKWRICKSELSHWVYRVLDNVYSTTPNLKKLICSIRDNLRRHAYRFYTLWWRSVVAEFSFFWASLQPGVSPFAIEQTQPFPSQQSYTNSKPSILDNLTKISVPLLILLQRWRKQSLHDGLTASTTECIANINEVYTQIVAAMSST